MRGITIENLCYNFPPVDWIYDAEPQYADDNRVFFDVLPMFDDIAMILNEGDKLNVDGMIIDIMKVPDDYLDFDPGYTGGSTVNDTCVVFKIISQMVKMCFSLETLDSGQDRSLPNALVTDLKVT